MDLLNTGNRWAYLVANKEISEVPLWTLYQQGYALCLIRLYTIEDNGEWKHEDITKRYNKELDILLDSGTGFYIGFEYDITKNKFWAHLIVLFTFIY